MKRPGTTGTASYTHECGNRTLTFDVHYEISDYWSGDHYTPPDGGDIEISGVELTSAVIARGNGKPLCAPAEVDQAGWFTLQQWEEAAFIAELADDLDLSRSVENVCYDAASVH